MIDKRMALPELLKKQADSDVVRDMQAYAADRIVEMEVEARADVAKGARSPVREVQRKWLSGARRGTRAGRIAPGGPQS
ncbi:putative transposase [Aurantimonas sp. 22II-16-19i]|nr:putative transposase [Aurantimonas sp. 22II-16-19i]